MVNAEDADAVHHALILTWMRPRGLLTVAGLALERETKANFSLFQEWLEAHNEYKVIVDGANIALYQQNFAEGGFSLTQSSWMPLSQSCVIDMMENGHLYWLYAAIRLNCLLVTNDEMRDHIFELLGSSFFPKWKQRHQVKYTFNKGKAVLMMPPPYSSEIQESEMGSWHVPMEEKSCDEGSRIWLCIDRMGSCKERHEAPVANGTVQASSPSEATNEAEEMPPFDKAGLVTGKRKDRE